MIVSIASGKGGTGKTTVATNLAVALDSVVQLLDCDVEEPNAHLFMHPVFDLTETIFVKAWEALPRFRPQGATFRAWLYRIAHNAVIDRHRTHKTVVPLEQAQDWLDVEASSPEEATEAAQESATLGAALSRSPMRGFCSYASRAGCSAARTRSRWLPHAGRQARLRGQPDSRSPRSAAARSRCPSAMKRDARRDSFMTYFLLTMSGNLWLIIARDPATFYASFALMTFAAYGLVVHTRTPRAVRAGRIYLVMAVLGEVCIERRVSQSESLSLMNRQIFLQCREGEVHMA